VNSSSTPGPRLLSGRYLLGERLGRGGMGDVYRATDQVLARQVAVKVFRPDVSDDALHLRHQSEARVLAGLNHPGLVAVYDIGTQDEQPFLVMELVEGETLAQLIHRGPLEPRYAASLGGQLAASLQAIHDAGVIHRDVKPANVMVRAADDGTPLRTKLTDFGIARLVDGTRLTSTGLLLGTVQYLSPEQTIGGTVSYPSDVYALGLVLLECLTGGPAFPGVGIESAVVRLSRQPEVPAALGGQWGGLLEAMTAREPEDRPTAGEVAATLGGLTADARAGSTGTASVAPLVPHAPVVPAGHAPGTAAPGLEPSGSPAAHDDARTEVGEAPYRAGRPVTSRRRRRATWGLSAAAAAALAALVTVAATWSGAGFAAQPTPGASSPATPAATPSAAQQTRAGDPSSTAAPVAATGTAAPVSTPTTRATTAVPPRRSPSPPSAPVPSPRPGSGAGSKHQAGPKPVGTKPGPPKAKSGPPKPKSGPGKGTSGGGKAKHGGRAKHGGKAKPAAGAAEHA
jgi:eukaryotic-like serine/threonine-protein kinase